MTTMMMIMRECTEAQNQCYLTIKLYRLTLANVSTSQNFKNDDDDYYYYN